MPAVPAGTLFNDSTPTVNQVSIRIGGMPASVLYAGITSAGLYEINMVAPNTGSGDKAVDVTGGLREEVNYCLTRCHSVTVRLAPGSAEKSAGRWSPRAASAVRSPVAVSS